jgi:hypothetical protein
MLSAKKISVWRSRYEITSDGRPVAVWDPNLWRTGGSFELAGRPYAVRTNTLGSRFALTDGAGVVVAAARRVGRKRWSVEADGRSYQFQRTSPWRNDQTLMVDGQPAGSVRRVSMWRSDAVADLPGLPLPLQVFVFVVVLVMWDAQAATAVSAG